METAGHEDDLLPALSSYKPAARLACTTDVVSRAVSAFPRKGPPAASGGQCTPIPTQHKRALPVKAHNDPVTMSGLKKTSPTVGDRLFSWFHTTASRVRRCDAGGHPCGGSSGSYDQCSWVPLLGWRCGGGYRPQHRVGWENRHNISLVCEDAVTRNPQERPRLHTQRQRSGEGDATLAVGRRVAGAPATLVHAAGGAARPQSVASAGALGLMALSL